MQLKLDVSITIDSYVLNRNIYLEYRKCFPDVIIVAAAILTTAHHLKGLGE